MALFLPFSQVMDLHWSILDIEILSELFQSQELKTFVSEIKKNDALSLYGRYCSAHIQQKTGVLQFDRGGSG